MTTNQDGPNTAGAAELKPCPFCGGEAKIADNTGPKLCTAAHAYVFCATHGCPGAGHEQDTVAEAIAAWNTRPTPAAQELKPVADAIIRDICELDGEYDLSEDETVMMVNAEDLRVILDRYFPALDQIADHANCSVVPDEVVEAVARTLCSASGAQWRERGNRTPEALAITDPDALNNHWRYKAKAALTAAIPAIKAQVLAEIVAYLRMGEHVHSRSGSIESEMVFKLIADAIERGEHEND